MDSVGGVCVRDHWQHYKGRVMVVDGFAELESTGEVMVIYHPHDSPERIKVRSLSEWLGWVPGEKIPTRRYTYLQPISD